MDQAITCFHGFVEGHVQGVFFRLETQKQAQKLGITGWVRNTDDGRVEVMICGSGQALGDMRLWLRQGPARARVTDLLLEQVYALDYDDFLIIG